MENPYQRWYYRMDTFCRIPIGATLLKFSWKIDFWKIVISGGPLGSQGGLPWGSQGGLPWGSQGALWADWPWAMGRWALGHGPMGPLGRLALWTRAHGPRAMGPGTRNEYNVNGLRKPFGTSQNLPKLPQTSQNLLNPPKLTKSTKNLKLLK